MFYFLRIFSSVWVPAPVDVLVYLLDHIPEMQFSQRTSQFDSGLAQDQSWFVNLSAKNLFISKSKHEEACW